jgi:Dockerin type I domain
VIRPTLVRPIPHFPIRSQAKEGRMKTSNQLPRVRRQRCLTPELLEDRMVMSAGQGSTFAIIPASVTTAGQATSTSFTINSSLFTPAKNGKLELGLDITAVAPSSTSTSNNTPATSLAPEIMSMTSSSGKPVHIEHTHYYPKIAKANHLGNAPTSAVLFTIKPPASGSATYTVNVKGLDHTTGEYLLGFYLPGDASGDGTVNSTDITTIKSLVGDTATNSNYNFDADVNRDGIINHQDVKLAEAALGESTKISPVVSVNLNPAADPNNDRTTAYSTVQFAGLVTPGASVVFANNSNSGATTTATADSTGAYNISVPLVSGSNTFTVTTHDGFGQSISGAISPVVLDPNAPTSATTSS